MFTVVKPYCVLHRDLYRLLWACGRRPHAFLMRISKNALRAKIEHYSRLILFAHIFAWQFIALISRLDRSKSIATMATQFDSPSYRFRPNLRALQVRDG